MSDDDLTSLSRAAHSAPYLPREREAELMRRWRDHGDVAARNEVVEAHLRLAVKAAAAHARRGAAANEIAQEANVALLKAADGFDPDRGFRFSTYAEPWIRAQLQEYVIRNGPAVRIGSSHVERTLHSNLNRARKDAEVTLGPGATRADVAVEVARLLGVGLDEVLAAMQGVGRVCSLDAPGRDDDGGEGGIASTVPSNDQAPDEVFDGVVTRERRRDWIEGALRTLPERERVIVRSRQYCDPDDVRTFENLASELGVSRERVRQLEDRAMRKLRLQMSTSPWASMLSPDLVDA